MFKKVGLLGVLIYFGSFSVAYGFCTWGIVPQERLFEPLNATEILVTYNDGIQTNILRPEFRGDAKEFAIVFPTPSKPEINQAPERIFEELNNATNPWQPVPLAAESADAFVATTKNQSVTVVEEKQVGDFDVTVLTATDSGDLIDWLEENDFAFGDADEEKMEYYVSKPGFHFIALKVDMSQIPIFLKAAEENVDLRIAPPIFFGELSPIEISFATDKPQLPMRTLKSAMPTMTFDLYMLGDRAWYIPGVDTIYADIVDQDFLKQTPSLVSYDAAGKWIVRQEVIFEPKNSDNDVYLTSRDSFKLVRPNSRKIFDLVDLDPTTGILPGVRGILDTTGPKFNFTRSLTIGSRGEDVRELQKLLNAYGFTVSEEGAGSVGNETTYFGTRTKQALVRLQNFYRSDILVPVGLSSGTGYFGPSTRKFINR